MTTSEELAGFLAAPEGARLEFKAAMGGFHFEELLKYIVALANEGGGNLQQVIPHLSQRAVQRLLEDLRATGRASLVDAGRGHGGSQDRNAPAPVPIPGRDAILLAQFHATH